MSSLMVWGVFSKATKAPFKCLVLAWLLLVVRAADEASSGTEASLVRAENGRDRGRRSVRSEQRRAHEVSLHPLEGVEHIEVTHSGDSGHVLADAEDEEDFQEQESQHGHSLVEVSADGEQVAGTTIILATAAPPTTTAATKKESTAKPDVNAADVKTKAANATEVAQDVEVINSGSPILGISFIIILALTCGGLNRYYREKMAAARTGEGRPEGQGNDGTGSNNSDIDEGNLGELGEDVYAAAIMSIIRDLTFVSKPQGSQHSVLRWCRIGYHVGLLTFSFMVQVVVLHGICTQGMPDQVLAIRTTYDEFEKHMYAGKIYKTENGYARGISRADYDASRFESLPDDVKENTCRIPFSTPSFLAVILFLWVSICVGEMRQAYTLFDRIILNTERSETMSDAISKQESGEDVIVKVTLPVKLFLGIFVLLPRFVMAGFLVWVGCRWLSATNDFGNLVFNGVGLEFVLLTKDFVYKGLVSDRAQREVANMKTLTLGEDSTPTPTSFLGSIQWGCLAIVWTYLYIYSFQKVLPNYRWDVAEVCYTWRQALFNKQE